MLSIAVVRAWRPDALHTTSDGLTKAATSLDDQIDAVRKAMDRAAQDWRGDDADAAAERAHQHLKDGRLLLDALTAARDTLRSAAEHIGTTRADLLATVDATLDQGLGVADDGTVTAVPSALSAGAAAAARDIAAAHATTQVPDPSAAAHRALGHQVQGLLQAVADADYLAAAALARIEVPPSMQAEVDRIIARAAAGEDVSTLLAWGAGGLALAQVGMNAAKVAGKSLALTQYFRAIGSNPAGASAALSAFTGMTPTGVMGRLANLRVLGPGARLASKAFIPLTFASGTYDAITGGGYDGGRAWAARGFGVAGAVGSVGVAAGMGWLGGGAALAMTATGPIGLGIAGAAVAVYGAWQLGNAIYDHREAIGQFVSNVGGAAGSAVDLGAYAVDEATQWAGDRLADAGDWAGDRLGDVADFGKKLLPVKMPDLNPF